LRRLIRLLRIFACASLVSLPLSLVSAQGTRTVGSAQLAALLQSTAIPENSHRARADVTVVDYFDYNCPDCRALDRALRKLLAADRGVRLIRKDWTIFGNGSVYAAYASFAAARQGAYQQAHDALITSANDLNTKAEVLAVLKDAGLDAAKIDADVAIHEHEYAAKLALTRHEAEALGLHGTPGLIVGNQLVVGGGRVDYARLQRLVANARHHASDSTDRR
jgi:protein-disulfide isomerase